MKKSFLFLLCGSLLYGCFKNSSETDSAKNLVFKKGTFGYDINFLKQYDEIYILKTEDERGQIIVSPKYQAKVFTSTTDGLSGYSLGWVNYDAFERDIDLQMNAFGGENRIWLGPEGGKYSLFFGPGEKMEFENWTTPSPIDIENWDVEFSNRKKIILSKDAQFQNYVGSYLHTSLKRRIEILESNEIFKELALNKSEKIQIVGFRTENTITNLGKENWNRKSGMPCIWILDMFKVSPQTVMVIPFEINSKAKIATTDYFGEISEERIIYKDSVLLFKADGKSRGKIGIGPQRAKPIAGSFDSENQILTITKFSIDREALYLNQEWTLEKDPFKGDVVNAYNDGPLGDGSQLGPFYELESVSPAAFLKPGESLTHNHNVYHFTGDRDVLNQICTYLLGIPLHEIQNAFKP